MGKSSKKSATKVEAAVVPVPQSGKKGKRGAENVVEKAVSAKKQKVEKHATVLAEQKVAKKQPKKAASSSSEEDSDLSDSDSEPKVIAKKAQTPATNGSAVAKKAKADTSSDSDSSGSDSDEKPAAKKQPAAARNGSVAVKKTPAAESSSSESDSDEDEKPAVAVKNVASKVASSSDDSEDDSDSSDDEEKAELPKKAVKKPASSDSDDSSSDEDVVAKAAPAANKGKVESSDDSDDESSDDDEEPNAVKPKVQAAKESDSDEDSSDGEESEDEEIQKTPKKKDTDVKMVDAQKSAASTFQKTPKTPATPEATGSKTLFVGNLSFNVEESDVREFFKSAGEIVDVRFSVSPEGQFKGFGHVEFATAEAAQKALQLNDQELAGRPVRLDLARERGAATPQSRENSSFQRGGRSQGGSTAFVRGFDSSLGEDAIRAQLQELFESCGAINRISIPPDFDTGAPKGMAYVEFADSGALSAALEKDGENYLTVQEAKPRGDSSGGGGGRFDRGGRSGGRDGGRGGRFSGRGGRDGGRGGRFSGRGGRDGGRGGGRTPFRNSVPSGKKTTFGDD